MQVEQVDRSSLRMAAVGHVYARSGALADATRALSTLPKETSSRQLRIQKLRLGAEIVLARGDARGAWVQFQQAAALEAPGVLPEYVARGAAAAGELGTALAMYRRMAGDPGYYWRYPDHEPGRWFESLTRYWKSAGVCRSRRTRVSWSNTACCALMYARQLFTTKGDAMTDEPKKHFEPSEPFMDGMYAHDLRGKTAANDVDLKLLAFLLLMSVHRDLFLKTFPARGGFDMAEVEKGNWLAKGDIPEEKLKLLASHRDALILIQGAWKEFADYEDPPCPRDPTLRDIVEFLKTR